MWSEAHVIRRIEHADGRVMYEHPGQTERVLSQQSAYMLVNMLETAASSGSARALSATGFPVAGKTGTAEMGNAAGNRDIWTVACTPTTVVSVWMGFDEPDAAHALPEGTGGSGYPARLAAQFLAEIADRASAGNFALPAGVTQALVDGLAWRNCTSRCSPPRSRQRNTSLWKFSPMEKCHAKLPPIGAFRKP